MNRQILFVVVMLLLGAGRIFAQGTAFSYQGQLNSGGSPANGSYDLRFAVYDAVTNGNRDSIWLTNFAVPVSNGLFVTTLDFGDGIFAGNSYWLDIAVRATNVATFTSLVPRQPILPVPYAIFANSASNVLGAIPAGQLSGTVGSSQISGTYANSVNFNNVANSFAGTFGGTFSGQGGSLSNLNASQLATGTVADARLTTNVSLLDRNQTYTGANMFTNVGNRFTGSFFGNGNVGWDAFSGPNVQAEFNHGYLLTNSQLATVTLPLTPAGSESTNVGYIIRVSGAGTGGWRVAQNANQSIYGNFLTAVSSDWHSGTGVNAGLNGIASSADGLKMVAVSGSSGGGVFASTDSGKTWSNVSGSLMTCVASSADGIKLAVGNNAGASSSIILSTNAGSNWFSPVTTVAHCQAIASSADGILLVAVVKGGNIYTSSDSGLHWTARSSSMNWNAVASSSDGSRLAAVVSGGFVYTSSNSGVNWAKSGSPSANWTSIASSSDGSQLAAVVSGGGIYTSSDYGATWTQQANAPTSAGWSSIDCSSDGTRLVASVNGGGIYLSANSASTWIKLSVGDQNWTGITCSADCTKMAAVYATLATSGGAYYGQAYFQATTTATTAGTSGYIGGSQGTAVELQYIGNNRFMPVSSTGTIWAN